MKLPAPDSADPSSRGPRKIDRKWAWHHRTLLNLRDAIIGALNEHSAEATEPVETHGVDVVDTAQEQLDRDLLLAELRAEGNELSEIDAALQRLRDGTYGICEETRRPIGADRLKALPWTRYSRPAAERLEKRAPPKTSWPK